MKRGPGDAEKIASTQILEREEKLPEELSENTFRLFGKPITIPVHSRYWGMVPGTDLSGTDIGERYIFSWYSGGGKYLQWFDKSDATGRLGSPDKYIKMELQKSDDDKAKIITHALTLPFIGKSYNLVREYDLKVELDEAKKQIHRNNQRIKKKKKNREDQQRQNDKMEDGWRNFEDPDLHLMHMDRQYTMRGEKKIYTI